MSNTFSFEEAGKPAAGGAEEKAPQAFSFEEASGKPTPKGFMGHARDLGISALQGAISVPEAAVGLADIPTGGAVGKSLENEGGAFGFRPKQAREYLDTLRTDAGQQQQREFEQADGIIGKAQYAIENPSLVANAVVGSLPQMGAGGVIGRGIMAVAPKVGAVAAAAAGEGITAAGSAAEQIRQETADGTLTPTQAGLAAATGAATAGFGFAGGKVAQKLGIADAETLLTQGAKGLTGEVAQQAAMKSIPRKVIEGAISEGFLEELPQSASEQILQNMALGKDWSEGVDSAVVLGVLSGMAMGGGAAGLQGVMQSPRQEGAPGQAPAEDPAAQPAPAASPGLEMVRQAYAEQLQALQGQEAGEPDVPQSTPPDGRAILDAQAAQAQADRDAATAASRAVESPDDEILQSIGATAEPPHRAMGIDPAAGPLSTGAAIAVDTGVAGQMQAAAQAAQGQPTKDGTKEESNGIPTWNTLKPGDSITLYRGESEANDANGQWWTTDRKKAERYGSVTEVTLPAEVAAKNAARGHNGADEFVFPGRRPAELSESTEAAQASPAQRWTRMSEEERGSIAGQIGLPTVIARNLPRAGWATLNPDLQARIAKAMASATPTAAPSIEGVDLGNGWAAFRPESGTAGVPRAEMPQIKAEHRGAMVNFMNARGVAHQEETLPASILKPTQAEFSREKVARAKDFEGGNRAILVSADNHILDGHHQWMAAREKGEDVRAIRLNAPIRDLIGLAHDFPSSTKASGAEAGGPQYRDEIRQKAEDYGITTMFRPFADIERDVMAQDGKLAPEDWSAYKYGEDIAYALEPLDDIDMQDARTLSEEEQMRAMGFSEDEINEAINRASAGEGQGAPEQAQSGAAQEGRDRGAQEDPGQEGIPEGLTSHTNEDIARQEAAQGQGGLFDASAAANQEPIKNETRANAGPAADVAPAGQEAVKSAEFTSDGNGLSLAAKRLREISTGKPSSDADVGLNTQGGVKYVSFGDAVAAARRAIESGIKPVPFQIHGALDILIGDAQRVIDAAVGNAYAPESQNSPKDEAARPASGQPAVGNAPGPLEALFSDLNSGSTRKANKAKKAAAKLPQAARIEYVQANFHDLLIQMMEAGALEVNGATTLTEDNAPCL